MRVLVTGGGGFLGRHIVRRLLDRGDDVVFAARSDYPDVQDWGAVQVRGDLAEESVAVAAARGCDAVIHVAAKAGIWGDAADYERSNVVATRNVLAACEAHAIGDLVYTSTPSVTFDGSDHENGAPDLPYAQTFRNHYARTKARAERDVLSHDAIRAVSLRPHLVFGPGDPFLLPGVIARHREGKLARVGKGENRVDITYVENAAVAHLRALDALRSGAQVAGKAYFISDGEPVVLWDFLADVFERLGLPPLRRSVPFGVAYAVGGLLEGAHRAFGITSEPRMTRFAAQQVATSHWYDMEPARQELGYEPVVSRVAALEATIADLRARGLGG